MIYKIKLNILLLIKIFQTFIFSASKKSLKDEKTMKVERLIISYTKSFIEERKKIVFLHGWGQSKDTWDKQIKKLKKNYSVYSLDLPGFGKSDCPS
ncbi:MAG TPA: alpha/beta fold hydrolase, partial [Patescibacteria group bacterium]|nr:alpha/beta fold hydrolase [Patescibacteria group bacterium]